MIELIGKLINWQASPLHVGISVDDPTCAVNYDDWARLSGKQVRVTVEAVEEPKPRCPFCGGKVYITKIDAPGHTRSYLASCECGAHGEEATPQAALDALAEWLDVCPRCGGRSEYKNDWYMIPGEEGRIRYWHWAICTDKKCGVRSLQCDSKPEVAQWWYKRERRNG